MNTSWYAIGLVAILTLISCWGMWRAAKREEQQRERDELKRRFNQE